MFLCIYNCCNQTERKKAGGATSRAEKQALLLTQRQLELKQAALAAKKDGDLELARDYLRQAKGITPLIEASKCGLPVDMNSIPLSPNAKAQLNESSLVDAKSDDSFTLVSSVDCLEEASGTDQQIYENMEKQLIKQTKVCRFFSILHPCCKFRNENRFRFNSYISDSFRSIMNECEICFRRTDSFVVKVRMTPFDYDSFFFSPD